MKKHKILYIFLFSILIGCSNRITIPTNYYILEYYGHSEKNELKQEKPFANSVAVLDSDIPKTYDRRNIVIRYFGPKITYSEHDLWGVDLPEIIPNLIARRIQQYNLFKQVQRQYLDQRPEYEVSTTINNIELYQSQNLHQAHLSMDFYLRKTSGEPFTLHHTVNREELLLDYRMETLVQKINDLILEESDRFIKKIIYSFQGYDLQDAEGENKLIKLEKLLADTTMQEKMGRLLIPALTNTENEPPYKIYNDKDEEIDGIMGTAIALPVGTYSIKYGSGTSDQLMTNENIKINSQYKTIIEPDWCCLYVDVIDEKRDFEQVRYEIFDGRTGESYGTQYPVEKELGEQQRIWILKPGLYKITINNEPFNSYRDFTTVYLKKGKVQRATLVVGKDEQDNPTNLIGAGVLEGEEITIIAEKWRMSNAVHGNFNMNRDNEEDKDNPASSITVNTQFENKLIYNNLPFYYRMRHLTEFGTTKSTGLNFRISTDDFDMKNTFIFFMLKRLGLYSRVDINSHFFPSYYYGTQKFSYIKEDLNDTTVEKGYTKTLQVKSSVFPVTLKEGVGLNYRIFNSPRANLNLRAGFGMRQDINNNVYYLTQKEDSLNYKIFSEIESIYNEGTEVSIVGSFNLPFNLTYMTNADVLFPFDPNASITLDWENVFNLRLFKYISIYYKLKLRNKQGEDTKDYFVQRHSLFLRLTYFFR